MKTKFTCKICGKNFAKLTKENLCAYCYYNLNGVWSKEFQGETKNER